MKLEKRVLKMEEVRWREGRIKRIKMYHVMYLLPKMNVNFKHCKHVLIK